MTDQPTIITTIGEEGPKFYDIEIVKLLPSKIDQVQRVW